MVEGLATAIGAYGERGQRRPIRGLLAEGGTPHIATDIDDYAAQTQRSATLTRLVGGVVDRPGLAAGDPLRAQGARWCGAYADDLLYRKVEPAGHGVGTAPF
ncbi:MAG: hypothetical protein R2697_08690 [Ilumatobacteraceae bacterium]